MLADEAETHHLLPASHYAKLLQDRAPSEEEVNVAALHHHRAEDELAEVREHRASATLTLSESGGVWEFPEAQVEAGERVDAEDRGGERHVERPRAVDEDELLDALGDERLDPARELPLARGVRVVAADEVDGAEGAGVSGDGAGEGVGDRRRVGARGVAVALEDPREEVRVGEGERRAAPDGAPAAGERGGARGVLGGEAGDDVAEERERERADAVLGVVVGGGGECGQSGAGVHGRVGKAHVEELEDALRAPLQVLRIHAAAPRVGRRGNVEVDERRRILVGHGRRRLREEHTALVWCLCLGAMSGVGSGALFSSRKN